MTRELVIWGCGLERLAAKRRLVVWVVVTEVKRGVWAKRVGSGEAAGPSLGRRGPVLGSALEGWQGGVVIREKKGAGAMREVWGYLVGYGGAG